MAGEEIVFRRLGGFVAKNPAVALTIAGFLVYSFVRGALNTFYDRFGIDPDEVGLGYAASLVRAGLGLLLLVLVAFLAAVVLSTAYLALDKSPGTRALVWIMLGPLLLLLAFMPYWYGMKADHVADGRALRPGTGATIGWILNPLGLRADPVHVVWLDGKKPPYAFGEHRVMYLGRSEGTVFLFDASADRTVSVSAARIALVRNQ